MKTFRAKPEQVKADWYVVDANNKILGRLASEIAEILIGKKNVCYTPGVDCGDFVIVINAEKIRVTGRKAEDKIYYRHSGYIGSLKQETFEEKLAKHPEEIIKNAVKGMVPHTTLGKTILKKLKVYAGEEHPHAAQEPQNWIIG